MSTGEKTVSADAARLLAAPRCGARTRAGTACRAPAVHGRSRCRMHGCGGGNRRQPAAIGGAAGQPERLEGRLLGRCRPHPAAADDRLHPGHGSKRGGDGAGPAPAGPRCRGRLFGCIGLFSVFSDRRPAAGIAGLARAAGGGGPTGREPHRWRRRGVQWPGLRIWSSSWVRLLISNSAQSGR